MRTTVRWGAVCALIAALGAGCIPDKEERVAPTVVRGRVLTVADQQVSIHEENRLYTLRDNPWSLYAWWDAAQRDPTGGPRTLVHFGARSSFGPASSVSLPELGQAGGDSAAQHSIQQLSDDGFLFAAMAAGWVDTVYWVQPEISCYSGPIASASFALEERDGQTLPVIGERDGQALPVPEERDGKTVPDFDPVELNRRAFSGEPVSRFFPIEVASGQRTSEWSSGPFQLYCLDREQLRERLDERGPFERVWVEVDLDYFGSSLPIEKSGYLALSDQSDFGVGLIGPSGPVFRDPPDSVRAHAAAVAELLVRLAPEAVAIVESPSRALGETLPDVEAILREAWLGVPQSSLTRALIPAVSIGSGRQRVDLAPGCAALVDVANQDSLRIAVRWSATPPERMEISLYYGRRGTPDRLIAQWRTLADRPSVQVAVPLARSTAILELGWKVEVRRLRDGALAFHGAFAMDRAGAKLDSLVSERRESVDPAFPDAEALRAQSPPELIVWGMQRRVPMTLLHEILLAHPSTLRSQCDDLRAHWIARAAPP